HFLVRALPRSSRPLALLLHGAVEFRGIEADALIAERIGNEIERKAKSVVEAESLLSRIVHAALRAFVAQEGGQLFIELAQPDVDGMGEALFFVLDHPGHAADALHEFGISVAHLLRYLLRHLEKKWPLEPEHAAMPHGAANDLPKHISAP